MRIGATYPNIPKVPNRKYLRYFPTMPPLSITPRKHMIENKRTTPTINSSIIEFFFFTYASFMVSCSYSSFSFAALFVAAIFELLPFAMLFPLPLELFEFLAAPWLLLFPPDAEVLFLAIPPALLRPLPGLPLEAVLLFLAVLSREPACDIAPPFPSSV